MRTLLLLAVLDVGAPVAGFDPAGIGLLRTVAPLGGELNGVAFSADGRLLAVGCGAEVRVYETGAWRPVAKLEGLLEPVQCVALAPDGKIAVAGGADGTVVFWQVRDGKLLHTLRFPGFPVHALAFSPDGRRLLTGGEDGRARAWTVSSADSLGEFGTGQGAIWSVAYARSGTRVAVGGEGNAVRIFRADGWTEERRIEAAEVAGLAFSADGARLMGHGAQAAQVWDTQTGAEIRKTEIPPGALARFTPDERFLVGRLGPEVGIWKVSRGGEPVRLPHHTAPVTGVAVHPGGRLFATIGQDRHLKIWGPVPGGMAGARPKGFLGVTVQDTANGRVLITTVYEKSAAEVAGLRAGDLLLKVGGQPLERMQQAVDQIGSFREGEEVEFEIDRGGEIRTLKVKLGKRPVELPN